MPISDIMKLIDLPDYQINNESDVDDALFELAYEEKVYQPKPAYYKAMD